MKSALIKNAEYFRISDQGYGRGLEFCDKDGNTLVTLNPGDRITSVMRQAITERLEPLQNTLKVELRHLEKEVKESGWKAGKYPTPYGVHCQSGVVSELERAISALKRLI